MKKVWVASDCVIAPLGNSSLENYEKVRIGQTGVAPVEFLSHSTSWLSLIDRSSLPGNRTTFEYVCSKAIEGVLQNAETDAGKTLLILSTTKGNISYLDEEKADHPRLFLHTAANQLASNYGFARALVVSNACISGVLALLVAKRYLEHGMYDHALVLGADALSQFIVSGFQSLAALSPGLCRPFDAARQGINLGEASAAILLSTCKRSDSTRIRLSGGGISNDANHISGPSRTGDELALAIKHALSEAKLSPRDIGFISAHGTATPFNDEMEAKAFHKAGLEEVPVHSLKGNFGHTLGAAGAVESVMSIHSLLRDEVLPTKGFSELGVSLPLNVSHKLQSKKMSACVKTASGFGGCNAAVVFEKE